MTYDFGKSITRSFYPLEDGEPVNLPSQAPSIFLFTDQPSRDDAAVGFGAMSAITYWNASSTSPYPRTYSIPPIYDPAPDSATVSRGYWEAINFVHAAGGQTQTVLRQFDVERTKAPVTVPGTTRDDIINAFPAITNYLTNTQIDEFLEIATSLMKLDLEKAGYAWGDYANLHKTNLALAFRTVAECSLSQFKSGTDDDRFWKRYEVFLGRYQSVLSMVNLKADSDGDGTADQTVTAAPSQVVIDH